MALESLCQLRPAKEFQPCKATQFSGNVLLRPSDSERRENEFAIYIHSVPFAGTDWSEQLEGRKALEDDLKRENPSNLLQRRRRTEHGRSNHNDGDRHGCRTNYFNSFVKDGKKGITENRLSSRKVTTAKSPINRRPKRGKLRKQLKGS